MKSSYDLIVVGAGPAGMAAAATAAEVGGGRASVLVLDEQPAPGGQIYRGVETPGRSAAVLGAEYAAGAGLAQDLRRHTGGEGPVDYLPGAVVWQVEEDGEGGAGGRVGAAGLERRPQFRDLRDALRRGVAIGRFALDFRAEQIDRRGDARQFVFLRGALVRNPLLVEPPFVQLLAQTVAFAFEPADFVRVVHLLAGSRQPLLQLQLLLAGSFELFFLLLVHSHRKHLCCLSTRMFRLDHFAHRKGRESFSRHMC